MEHARYGITAKMGLTRFYKLHFVARYPIYSMLSGSFAIAILFYGCAKMPDDKTIIDKTHVPQTFNNSFSNSLKGMKTTEDITPDLDYRDTFFHMFDDDILRDLATRAINNNTNLLTLESTLRQAKATAKLNTWNLFPSVSAGVNYNYSDNNYKQIQTTLTQNSANASLSFSWELDIFGKLNALREASKQQILEAMQNLGEARVTLIGDVADYYFTIRELRESILLNEKIEHNLYKIFILTQEKYNLGLIGLDSLATTKTNYLTQKNSLLALTYSIEQNKNALLVLLNTKEMGFDIESSYDFISPEIPNIDAMPVNVIFNRPDVRADVFALNASIYQRFNKKMALLPSISLSGSLGQVLSSPTLSLGDIVWQIAGSLTLPLLNRQSLTQDYIIAKESTKQAFYTLQNTINTAVGEIENALKNMQVTTQSLENAESSYEMNKDTYEIMLEQYKKQLIDEISMLEYENTYLKAKDTLVQTKLTHNQAAIALYKAFGGDFNPEALKDGDLLQNRDSSKAKILLDPLDPKGDKSEIDF